MKKYKWAIILLNLGLILLYFNHSIVQKERLLKDGQLVLLKLAPLDPRSLMQGDYMALDYEISRNLGSTPLEKRGYCIVSLDEAGRAERLRFQTKLSPLNEGEYALSYRLNGGWRVDIGANSFFFQEGHAKKYEKAKYGGLKVDQAGNSILLGLYDEELQKIE